ncbi:MAG: hypothetical protein KatS3mg113_0480 [Planctomycetaceae bacterium]|nr:MAG: hypothetical protein KatS3mg113_0480 [Planctomycetaceae bacterium]
MPRDVHQRLTFERRGLNQGRDRADWPNPESDRKYEASWHRWLEGSRFATIVGDTPEMLLEMLDDLEETLDLVNRPFRRFKPANGITQQITRPPSHYGSPLLHSLLF